jgi:peptide/nickel transport system permease protein
MLPPAWMEGGSAKYLLGTDDQGRDILSALMYGARISLLSAARRWSVGADRRRPRPARRLRGGALDAFIMRVCDVMLSFPSILIALLIAGVGRALFPHAHDSLAFGVLIIAIALPGWVQYARTVRGSTMVERNKEYVQAARVIGVPPLRIMLRHVLPNVLGPVLVLATINRSGHAIITEATLSAAPSSASACRRPSPGSLGTLIRIGNELPVLGRVVDHGLPRR